MLCCVSTLLLVLNLAPEALCTVDADLRVALTSTSSGITINTKLRTLFVSQLFLNRVLRYDNYDSLTATSPPSVVFGRADMTGTLSNQGQDYPSANTLSAPRGIWVDDRDTLWVADRYNSRVLWWNNASFSATNSSADGVLGHLVFTSNVSALAPDGLNQPCGLSVSGTTLWVADQGHSR